MRNNFLANYKENDGEHSKFSPLIQACIEDSIEDVTIYIQQGCNPNIINSLRISALMIAARNDNYTIAEILIKAGAQVNYCAEGLLEASTALMTAASSNSVETIKVLLRNKADINQVNDNGMTALMHASKNNNIEAASILLDNHANIEIKTFDFIKMTALSYAVTEGHYPMVQFLVENGAKVKPLRLLTKNDIHPKMSKWLKAHKWL